jgi:hypothetical protein
LPDEVEVTVGEITFEDPGGSADTDIVLEPVDLGVIDPCP